MNARPVACPILVGRDRELALLTEARRGLAQSRPAMVLVGGEAGIGKSRLLDHFLRSAAEGRSRTIVSVECLEHAPRPFGPVRDALVQLARATHVALPPELARFVGPSDGTAGAEAPEKADLFAAILAFVRERARDRATILTFEDLHWSDATTLEFLGYAASRFAGTRLLVVATYRSDETERNDALSAALARAVREPTTFRLDLRELKLADVRALLYGAQAGHAPLRTEALEEIALRAEGNPFFGEELLKNALEVPGPPNDRAGLPISIRASIVERLRAFSPGERSTIDRAAVLGLRFDPTVLARTMGTTVDAILPALRRARDANIVVEEDTERVRFRFRHALTRQAVYDDLLLFDARRTHRSILETLESFDAEDDYIEELAYHAWESRDAERTSRYNERAAERAFELYALPESRVCFERALDAATEPAVRARLLQRLGRVTSMLGDLHAAIDIYESAWNAFVDIGDFDRAALVVCWSAADRNNTGDAGSVAFGRAFLERFGDRLGTEAHDTLVAMLARLAMISYDAEIASALLERLREPDDLPLPGRQNLLFTRSELAWIAGDMPSWSRSATAILDLMPSFGPYLALSSGYTLAQAASFVGRDDLVSRTFALIDRTEARNDVGAVRAYAAVIRSQDHFARGRLDRARDTIRAAIEMPDVHVSTSALAIVAPLVADALDDDTLVTPDIVAEFASVRANARHPDDAAILAAAATMLLRADRRPEALADIRRALACVSHAMASSEPLLTLAALELEPRELPLLEHLLHLERYHPDDAMTRNHVLFAMAIAARRTGDGARAAELATEAARVYRTFGRPLLEGRALATAARTEDALAIFTRHGAGGYAKHLRTEAPATARDASHDPLSEREREVARYVADGFGNAAIAERLSITKKTVEKHVASIYDKLGVRSRAQLAGLLARTSEVAGKRASEITF